MNHQDQGPIHSPESEQSLLGAIFVDPTIFGAVSMYVDGGSFYEMRNRYVFGTMNRLADRGAEIDWIAVREDLASRGLLDEVGGIGYLQQVTNLVPAVKGWERFAEKVRDDAYRRHLGEVAYDLHLRCRDRTATIGDVQTHSSVLADAADAKLRQGTFMVADPQEIADQARAKIDLVMDQNVPLGWKSGNPRFDHHCLGYFKGAISAVAAHTGEGKTYFAWERCKAFTRENNANSGIVSGEMSGLELVERQVVGDNFYANAAIGAATDGDKQLALGRIDSYEQTPVYVAGMKSMKLPEIMRAVRILAKVRDCKLVFVDYMQMVRSDNTDPNEAAFEICGALKEQAAQLSIQIVLLSQLNKAGRRVSPLNVGEADIYGASAFAFACHTISVLLRLDHHASTDPKIARCLDSLKRDGVKPEGITLQRVIKSRRGTPSFITGYRTTGPVTVNLTDYEIDQIKTHLIGRKQAVTAY